MPAHTARSVHNEPALHVLESKVSTITASDVHCKRSCATRRHAAVVSYVERSPGKANVLLPRRCMTITLLRVEAVFGTGWCGGEKRVQSRLHHGGGPLCQSGRMHRSRSCTVWTFTLNCKVWIQNCEHNTTSLLR